MIRDEQFEKILLNDMKNSHTLKKIPLFTFLLNIGMLLLI